MNAADRQRWAARFHQSESGISEFAPYAIAMIERLQKEIVDYDAKLDIAEEKVSEAIADAEVSEKWEAKYKTMRDAYNALVAAWRTLDNARAKP